MRRLPRLFFSRVIIILTFLTITAWFSRAQSVGQVRPEWSKALESLADKIATVAKPAKTFSLDVRNISSLTAGDVTSIRQALVENLEALGLGTTQKLSSGTQLQVTLSESTDDYVWVVEVRRGDAHQVIVVSAARDASGTVSARESSLTLQRKLIWEQDARILDFAMVPDALLDDRSILLILEPDKIKFYDYLRAEWKLTRAIAIPRSRPLQRDVRGRIEVQAGKAELPEAQCSGNFQRPETVTCASAVTSQQAGRVSTPLVIQGRDVEDYAGLSAVCGRGPLTLSVGPGDWTETDFMEAYEGKDLADPVSQRIQFPGPILTLRASDDGKSARVVSRNLQTGAYEASIVSVSCGD